MKAKRTAKEAKLDTNGDGENGATMAAKADAWNKAIVNVFVALIIFCVFFE
jgi:hypothetical protein